MNFTLKLFTANLYLFIGVSIQLKQYFFFLLLMFTVVVYLQS